MLVIASRYPLSERVAMRGMLKIRRYPLFERAVDTYGTWKEVNR
jgi:hypothetical protein